MKKLLMLSALFLMTYSGIGQKLSKDFEVSTGTPYQVIDAPDKRYVPVGDGKVISVKTRGEIVTIQLFDGKSMKEIARKSYEDFPKYNKIQDLILIDGKLFYIYEAYNKKDKAKSFSVYSREIDVTKGTFINNEKLVTSSGPIVNLPSSKMGSGGNAGPMSANITRFGKKTEVIKSVDGSKVLVYYRLKPLERSDKINKDIFGFNVFDKNMKLLWNKEVTMPYTEKEMNNLAYTVNKEGKVFMLAYLNDSKKFELIKVDKDGKTENTTLDLDGDFVFEKFELIEDASGNILCAGYYANGYDFKVNWTGGAAVSFNTNGIYLFKMDEDGKVLSKSTIEFPLDLIEQYLTDKQKEKLADREAKGKAGMEDLRMDKIYRQADGSIMIIGEQQYVRSEMYGTSQQAVYHYGCMVITKLDKDGNHLWSKKLPKNQAGVASGVQTTPFFEGQMSFSHFKTAEGKHYILFVDNPKNENLPLNQVPAAHKNGAGGFISAFEVDDATGDVKRHTILDLKNIKGVQAYQFKVTRILEAYTNHFLMEIYIKGKQDTMVLMEAK